MISVCQAGCSHLSRIFRRVTFGLLVAATASFAMTYSVKVDKVTQASVTAVFVSSEKIFSISTKDSVGLSGIGLSAPIKAGHFMGRYVRWYRRESSSPDTIKFSLTVSRPVLRIGTFSGRGSELQLETVIANAKMAVAFQSDTLTPKYKSGLRIGVSKDGIYSLSGASLKSCGVPVSSIGDRNYHLYNKGKEVPVSITNEWHGTLADDDVIIFHAEELRADSLTWYTQYSSENVYWLTWDGAIPGLRAATFNCTPRSGDVNLPVSASAWRDTIHIEQDNDIRWIGDVATAEVPADPPGTAPPVDDWYWGIAGAKSISDFSFDLPSPAGDQGHGAILKLSLMGLTSVASNPLDHNFTIYLNGTAIGAKASWDGQIPFIYTSSPIAATLLHPGTNTLTFFREEADSVPDQIALNWIELDYMRNFSALDNRADARSSTASESQTIRYTLDGFTKGDIELWDTRNFRRFNGFQVAPSDGKYNVIFDDSAGMPSTYLAQSISNLSPLSARLDTVPTIDTLQKDLDWIAIVPDSGGLSAIAPLVALRQSQGYKCAAVPIKNLFARFSYGIKNPEAIRLFVQWLFARSPDHLPTYLLLAGDACHDLYKQRLEKTLVPTHLEHVPGWGPASDDDWFATIPGTDNFPQMAVGRLPAQSPSELSAMVAKIVRYETSFEHGPWHDRLLTLGGFETDFTTFNNTLADNCVSRNMSITRFDADPNSSWFVPSGHAAQSVTDAINEGVYAVNFCGHGGGNIWSDNGFFGIPDLAGLRNGAWTGGGRLPIIFSFTCLTGFFESAFYASLGEEMMRKPIGGALTFYGASGYTKRAIDEEMGAFLIQSAVNTAPTTVGKLVAQCEAATIAADGASAIFMTRQYNLLGDPATPWNLAPDSLSSGQKSLRGVDSVSVLVKMPKRLSSGSMLSEFWDGRRRVTDAVASVNKGAASQVFHLKAGSIADGAVRVFAWNDSCEFRGLIPFSRDSIVVADVKIAPALSSPGDSITVSCLIPDTSMNSSQALIVQYTTADPALDKVEFSGSAIVPMSYNSKTGRWTSSRSFIVPIPPTGIRPSTKLILQFRSTAGLSSANISLPLAGRPDLAFSTKGLRVVWDTDSLSLSGTLLNQGAATSGKISLSLRLTNDTVVKTIVHDSLTSGSSWDFTMHMPDRSGAFNGKLSATDSSGRETYTSDNSDSLAWTASFGKLLNVKDSLRTINHGAALSLVAKLKATLTVCMLGDTFPASGAVKALGESDRRYSIFTRPASSASFNFTALPDTPLALTASDTTTRMLLCDASGTVSRMSITGKKITATLPGRGPLWMRISSDRTPPTVRLMVDGRDISYTDFAPLNREFVCVISDSGGIDSSSVKFLLNSHAFASGKQTAILYSDSGRVATASLYPEKEHDVDTITVFAADKNGNAVKKSFTFRAGEELSIRFLSCHPCPFGAKAGQIVRFAYLLTDEASDVSLSIYTIAGRRIWTYKTSGGYVGYQEIQWDGFDDMDHHLANGTYYAKLTVSGSGHTKTKIIRIAKMEGYNR